MIIQNALALVFAATLYLIAAPYGHAADPAFDKWLASLWPEAQKLGVSRRVFDEATRNLEPDLTLPDLVIPGRPERAPEQPEFVLTPADYLKEVTLARLATQGRKLAAEHRATLARIEQQSGVPPHVVLAIWGRETAFGGYKLPHNAVRVLATQGFLGRRKEQFRNEFLLALKILQDGTVKLSEMRSSWAGAMGLTQFLPSDYYKYAVDFDGDGHANIWTSIPDALASAAKQLSGKGWQRGMPWAIEVRAPQDFDCTRAEPSTTSPVGDWLKRGFVPASSRKLTPGELKADASVLMPEGIYGPTFLAPKNYFVIKDYNFSDLYVLFVGNLADRIAGGGAFATPWSGERQLRTAEIEMMQKNLTRLGFYKDKIDGKAGMLTRSALGAWQKASGLQPDCWPTQGVIERMRRN